jgi:hypothetical protein
VHLEGTYGRPGHRRQRYKCFPAGGGRAHVFTELLPRAVSARSSATRVGRRRVSTSSSLVASPARWLRSARARPTSRPPCWRASGHHDSRSTTTSASCASRVMASSWPTGSSCSRRSYSSLIARRHGRGRSLGRRRRARSSRQRVDQDEGDRRFTGSPRTGSSRSREPRPWSPCPRCGSGCRTPFPAEWRRDRGTRPHGPYPFRRS